LGARHRIGEGALVVEQIVIAISGTTIVHHDGVISPSQLGELHHAITVGQGQRNPSTLWRPHGETRPSSVERYGPE